jgi:hypothetical protein
MVVTQADAGERNTGGRRTRVLDQVGCPRARAGQMPDLLSIGVSTPRR